MKRRSAHTIKLRISSEGAHVRLLGSSGGDDAGEDLDSYTVVVRYDAQSGAFSAWLAAPADRIRGPQSPHRRPPSGLAALSAREAEVLKRLALGEADKEIARVMAISTGTVKVHVKTIIRKLGVGNRTQAAIQAIGQHVPSSGPAGDLQESIGRRDAGPPSVPHHRPDDDDSDEIFSAT
jgi:DNA-binding CsgD family transcriptional regulator